MAGTATNVTAGKPKISGAIFSAPIGSTVPTDAITALDSAFNDLGYVSSDGVTRSISKSTTTIKEWGGGTVLITEDEKTVTVKLKLIEYLNPDVQGFVHGEENVTGTVATGMHVGINDDEAAEHIVVIDQVMKGGVPQRMVINKGVITEIGDTTYVGNNAVSYDLTITAMNPDGGGNKIDEYIGGQSA
jgi:hypothetical protein